jgi:hypothetical protein
MQIAVSLRHASRLLSLTRIVGTQGIVQRFRFADDGNAALF